MARKSRLRSACWCRDRGAGGRVTENLSDQLGSAGVSWKKRVGRWREPWRVRVSHAWLVGSRSCSTYFPG